MTITAKIILDSLSPIGRRLTTMQLCYPRFIHAEFMTHRVFSRNASSSRAIPVAKMIEQVRTDPAMPIHWGKNQPGMQANEQLSDPSEAIRTWKRAARSAADIAATMNDLGLHKQVANRILEPFQHMHVIVTATDWDNFFKLRLHPDAEPNIQRLAEEMKMAMNASVPVERTVHLPYIKESELFLDQEAAAMVSAARCARVSYLTHDGATPDKDKDMELALRLKEAGHASPFEHPAFADDMPFMTANFRGWKSFRFELEI
jgi:thymidylate synthase ThyX